MTTKAYFVSDIHLRSGSEKNAQVLVRFLKSLLQDESVTHLFLVGDIFDFWISDHGYFIEKFGLVVEALDKLVQRGVKVHYFEGNHDLHLERYWQRKLGVQVFTKPEYFHLDSLVVRVEHGDLTDHKDYGYRFLKCFLSTKTMKLFADHMHESVVSALGERASRISRHYTSVTKPVRLEEMLGKMHAYAEFAYDDQPYDLLISGHVHIKDDYSFERGGKEVRSINLGSWMEQPLAFLVTDQKQEFVTLV